MELTTTVNLIAEIKARVDVVGRVGYKRVSQVRGALDRSIVITRLQPSKNLGESIRKALGNVPFV